MGIFPRRIIAGLAIGIFTSLAAMLLVVETFKVLFGGQLSVLWILISLVLIFIGPILLGRTNASWPRAIVSGIVSPLLSGIVYYFSPWILTTIDDSVDLVNIEDVPVLATVYIVCVIGFTELLSANREESSIGKILTSAVISLMIIVFIELVRNLILRGNTNLIVRHEWLTGVLIITYFLLSGVNMIFNLDVRKFYSGRTLNSMYLVLLGVNLFIFISINLLSLVTVNMRI